MIFVVVAAVFYGAFRYFVTSGTRKETKEMEAEIALLLPRNAQAQIASQRLNEFRAIYKARQEEYDELKALLPEQRELTMVLQGLQDRAHNTGIIFRRFNPKEDVQQENYRSGRQQFVRFIESLLRASRSVPANCFDYQLRTEADRKPISEADS
jgi:Tfp pilus assembly protein PilO